MASGARHRFLDAFRWCPESKAVSRSACHRTPKASITAHLDLLRAARSSNEVQLDLNRVAKKGRVVRSGEVDTVVATVDGGPACRAEHRLPSLLVTGDAVNRERYGDLLRDTVH